METRQVNQEPLIVGVPSFVTFNKQESTIELKNPSFYPCSVRIMAIDTVANKIRFSEQTTVKALPSLANVPLVALYKEDINDFGDHELYRDEDGHYRYNTYPIGTIPESANQWVEFVADNEGKEVMYLCSDALLWKRQHKEFSKIVEMEQAGCIAVAQCRGFDYGALIYGGDDVSQNEWSSRSWRSRKGIRYDLVMLCKELLNVI